jgi:excisionase family DNA binding protein
MNYTDDAIDSKSHPGPFDPPLSVAEAAEALNVRRSTIYTLLRDRQIAAVKICGATRIRSSEITRFFESPPPAKYEPLGPKQGRRSA